MKKALRFWEHFKLTAIAWYEDNCLEKSAALSYYTVLFIGPLLLVSLMILGNLLTNSIFFETFLDMLNLIITPNVKIMIINILITSKLNGILSYGSILTFFFLFLGATGVLSQVKTNLDEIFGCQKKEVCIKTTVKNRLVFSLVIIFIVILIISSVVLSSLFIVMSKTISNNNNIPRFLLTLYNSTFSYLLAIAIFTFIYKFIHKCSIKWKFAISGGILSSFLFSLSKYIIEYLIINNEVISLYGAISTSVAFLVAIFYNSFIFYFVAEWIDVLRTDEEE